MVDIPGNNTTTTTISVGGSLSNSLEIPGDRDWIRITLNQGQSISIALTSNEFDSYLRVRDAAGNLLYENDDSGGSLDSRVAFTASTSGTYYIEIGSYDDLEAGAYQLAVDNYTPPPVGTIDQIADYLSSGYWGGDSHHFAVSQGGSLTVNLGSLTAEGLSYAREALNLWSDVIGIQFIEVANGGQITFDDDEEGAFSEASWWGGITQSAHVNVSTAWLDDYRGDGINNYAFQSYVHEVGHALGLGHAGNYNFEASFPYDAEYLNDGWPVSIMSYFDQDDSTYYADLGFSQVHTLTPMLADVLAMSQLYGLSTTTRTGDTVYGFNSTAGRDVFNASLYPNVAYTIVDGGGTDTLDYSGFGAVQRIDLNSETFLNVGGLTGNVSIARGTVIENAIGGAGNDTIIGNNVANVLSGGGGMDSLTGGAGNDTLLGGAQDDTLDGGTGNDSLYGGLGNDIYYVDSASDQVIEADGEGADSIVTTASFTLGADSAVEALSILNPLGTSQIFLIGNDFAQTLSGNAGSNFIDAGGGNDTLVGYAGSDTLIGGSGADILDGGDGFDTLASFSLFFPQHDNGLEHDQLSGGAGNDTFYSGFGDSVDGGSGTDLLRLALGGLATGITLNTGLFNAGQAFVLGGATIQSIESVIELQLTQFNDVVTLGTQADAVSVYAGAGNDVITSQASVTNVYGEAGDDLLLVGTANGFWDGGEGIDTLDHRNATASIAVDLLNGQHGSYGGISGIENVNGSDLDDTIVGSDLANVLNGGGGGDFIDGLGGNDIIDGGAGNDTLNGGLGADRLIGNAGADRLDGGAGGDTMFGGAGDDVYVVDNAADKVIENFVTLGTDLVEASIRHTLSTNIDNLTLTGVAAINGTGNDLANILIGNSAANTLNGAGGADVMQGGLGNDIYIVNHAGDQVIEQTSEGNDLVKSSVNYTLGANIERLTLSLGAAEGTGNDLANILIGNAAANLLDGGAGVDEMRGAAGDDIYVVDHASDKVVETAVSHGNDTVLASVSYSLGSRVENLTLTGTDAINASGNAGANTLTGNGAANTLNGAAGADQMIGGGGDDLFVVDNVGDQAIELSAADGTDRVNSSVSFTLGAHLDNLTLTKTAAINGTGNGDANTLTGNSAANVLDGGGGADILLGAGGADTLDGGAGRDSLTGGTGADAFRFQDGGFAGLDTATCDVILDFSLAQGDTIQLDLVDADTGLAGDQEFAFIGGAAFGGTAGELRTEQIDGNTYLQGDTNGDSIADFLIRLDGLHTLTNSDFLL